MFTALKKYLLNGIATNYFTKAGCLGILRDTDCVVLVVRKGTFLASLSVTKCTTKSVSLRIPRHPASVL